MEFKADYHVHYHLDACAADEMTFENIDEMAHRLGLSEIAVLAHCSAELPNGGQDWGFWHRLDPVKFDTYLKDHRAFRSRYGLRILTGVETELMDSEGHIAVSPEVEQSVDLFALSLHYLPRLDIIPWMPDEFPLALRTEEQKAQFAAWRQEMEAVSTEEMLAAVVDAYCAAIRRNPKVRSLAHCDDLSYTLGVYGFSYDGIPEERLAGITEPLMRTAAQHEVLWEITEACAVRPMFARAKELGVKFSPTADAHFLDSSWGPFTAWPKVYAHLGEMGLSASPVVLK